MSGLTASLISACFLSVFWFKFVLTSNFLFGAAVVVVATFMYLLEDDVIGAWYILEVGYVTINL